MLLPQASVTFHVLCMTPVLLHPSGTISTSVRVTTRFAVGVQLSLTIGLPVTAGKIPAAQSTIILAGHVIEGFTMSLTVICCTQDATFPQPSMADQVRTIEPVLLQPSVA